MDTTAKRRAMVDWHIAGRGISDPRVLAALMAVPRELFVPDWLAAFAYADVPLSIGAGQTISQPYIVALMLQLAELGPTDRVLEVGAGSGYAAAVMSRIAAQVFAIERLGVLANAAHQRLTALGYDNITIYHRDGTTGLPEKAPFNAIVVSAAADDVPQELCNQLKIGGRLLIPVGGARHQVLKRIWRDGSNVFREETHGSVAFVALVSREKT